MLMYSFVFSSPIFVTTIHNKGIYTYHLFFSTALSRHYHTYIYFQTFFNTPLTTSVSLRQKY